MDSGLSRHESGSRGWGHFGVLDKQVGGLVGRAWVNETGAIAPAIWPLSSSCGAVEWLATVLLPCLSWSN